jgi:aminoglycoside phosphotransferase family enzyme/predicted kinase
MAAPTEQAEVVHFLQALAGSAPLETHISLVFVGTETVWKLKKAVRLAFLDFTSLEQRRRYAERELALNAPVAPCLYRDVVSVVRREDGRLDFGQASEGKVLDWVLRMARVPATDFFDAIAAAGRLTPELLDALGDAVAAFHRGLSAASVTDIVASMREVMQGNVRSARDAGLPEAAVAAWQMRLKAAFDVIAPWLAERERAGLVRRAHGDLHLGNFCLWRGRPVPFDALEFDEAMATIDLGYDLAFLLMDLDRRVSRAAANRVLNRYVAQTADTALTRGLPVFLSLRAMIRAHVEAKRANAAAAAAYLAAASAYLEPRQSVVLAIGGLPGSGKSTLARILAPELGPAPGALVLRSDEIRKRQHGAAPEERLSPAAYSDAANDAVAHELARLVRESARSGHAVIADATFIDLSHRAEVEHAARAQGIPFLGLWLTAPLAELEARILARRYDASDATVAVLRAASRNNPQARGWVEIDARSSKDALSEARTALARLTRP